MVLKSEVTNTELANLADIQRLLWPFRDQTNTLQTDTMSLSYVISSLLCFFTSSRFAIFLNPSSPGFDPLPAAACLLDPTVSTILTDRGDTSDLLAAAKAFIKVKVSNRLCKKLAKTAFLKVNNKFYDWLCFPAEHWVTRIDNWNWNWNWKTTNDITLLKTHLFQHWLLGQLGELIVRRCCDCFSDFGAVYNSPTQLNSTFDATPNYLRRKLFDNAF